MRVLRRYPAFAALWSAGLFSTSAGWVLGFALSVHVFETTGSTVASAALVVVSLAPQAVVGGRIGALADRVDRGHLIRGMCGARVVGLVGLGVVPDSLAAILVFAGLNALSTQAAAAAEQGLVVSVVPRGRLTDAAGMTSLATNAARLTSPALGGALMAALGFRWTSAVVVGLLLAAIGALLFVPRPGRPQRPPPNDSRTSALRLLVATPVLRAVAGVQVLDSVKEGALSTLFPVVMLQVIGTSEAFMGAVNSSFAVTALAAGPLLAVLMRRVGSRALIAGGSAISGAFLLLLAIAPSETTALTAFAGAGLPFTLSWSAMSALVLLHGREDVIGRVVGGLSGINAGVTGISALTAGILAAQVGPLAVLAVAAIAQMFAGLLARRGLPART